MGETCPEGGRGRGRGAAPEDIAFGHFGLKLGLDFDNIRITFSDLRNGLV